MAVIPATNSTLREQVWLAERRGQLRMLALLAPSVLFVAFFVLLPIALFLFRSIDNSEIPRGLHRTVESLRGWSGQGLPAEESYAALARDLRDLRDSTELTLLARRLNYNISGYRGLILETARDISEGSVESTRNRLVQIDGRWGKTEYWAAIKNQSNRLTLYYLLASLDLRMGLGGVVEKAPAETALFIDLYLRTLLISASVAALCLIIGFPVASVMAASTPATANVLFMLVLIPFWTSLLVRTTAWIILLQNEGPVNQTLVALGLLSKPVRLVFNRIGLFVSMVHVLLPYMILPLYSVLKGISRDHLRAAASLGASPLTLFRTVYMPLAMPGIVAGWTLVFVLSLGYYVTPALVGGPGDQMIGYFVAYFTNSAVNWGMASALGSLLLLIIGVIYFVLSRAIGLDRLRIR